MSKATPQVNQRLFQTPEDLWGIGKLIRRVYATTPYWNAWSFCRFDIWAQRRLGDEHVLGKTAWQENVAVRSRRTEAERNASQLGAAIRATRMI